MGSIFDFVIGVGGRGGGGVPSARVISCWLVLIVVVYLFVLETNPVTDSAAVTTSSTMTDYEKLRGSSRSNIIRNNLNDAVVYIAMGSIMASDPLIDYSIASVRKIGKWKGDIFILTDNPSCFTDSVKEYNLKVVKVQPQPSLIHIKALKTKIWSYLPTSVEGVLYLDVDIVVTRNFESFLLELSQISTSASSASSTKHSLIKKEGSSSGFDIGAFPDAKGHYVGFCSGCEKWHTGVLWMLRGSGEKCLRAWEEVLLSGKFDTDQQSLDEAESRGACANAVTLPPRYLLFAKDYIGMALTSGHTFLHVTSAARLETQDYLYKKIVVPRLRSALLPVVAMKADKSSC